MPRHQRPTIKIEGFVVYSVTPGECLKIRPRPLPAKSFIIQHHSFTLRLEPSGIFPRVVSLSVNFNETTRRNIPESPNLHTRRRENLKSHIHSPITVSSTLNIVLTEKCPKTNLQQIKRYFLINNSAA
jgi:hypothetical protein